MEIPFPLAQHLDTNYVPTSEELDDLKALLVERQAVIDAIDAEIAELERKRVKEAQGAERIRALTAPVRRLPDDILLTIFFKLLASAEPWSTPHPSVITSHVCHRWRGLALGTPLLWTKIEIQITLTSLWSEVCNLNPPPPHMDIRPYVGPYISLCRRSLLSLAERVHAFMQRSSGCPLQLHVSVCDRHHPQTFVDPWSELFEPLAKVVSDPTIRWESIDLNLGIIPEPSLALHFLSLPAASLGSGMANAMLRFQVLSPIPEALWNAVIPGGKLDLRLAQLHSFTARMPHGDLSRICISWDGLTTLSFGSPLPTSVFLPQEALSVLLSTPRLIRCTIHLSIPAPHRTPPLNPLTLSHLKSLTLAGDVPPRSFAEALHLPALTRLWTEGATGLAEEENTSAVCLWIERYGARLAGVSIAYSSLTKRALVTALVNLPNVQTVALNFHPKDAALALLNVAIGVTASEVDIIAELDAGNVGGYVCPKLRVLGLRLGSGSGNAMADAIVDLVEGRRSVDRSSSISRLEKLDISFRTLPKRDVLSELERNGVGTDGLSIYPEPGPRKGGW